MADRLVSICRAQPSQSIGLSELASRSQWAALERQGLAKSLKRFLSCTCALAIVEHESGLFAAIARPLAFIGRIDLAIVSGIVEQLRCQDSIVVDGDARTCCLQAAWVLRSELVVDIADNTVSVSLGERQVLQNHHVNAESPCESYLTGFVYPFLDLLSTIAPHVSINVIMNLLKWQPGWPPLERICGLDVTGDQVVLRRSSEGEENTFERILMSANGDVTRLLAINSFALRVVFCELIPRLATDTAIEIHVLESKSTWGLYTYALGTLENFLNFYQDVFFVSKLGQITSTVMQTVTVIHILSRVVLPLFHAATEIPLPELYAATCWAQYFQPRFGPLQNTLGHVGLVWQRRGHITVASAINFPTSATSSFPAGAKLDSNMRSAKQAILRAAIPQLR